METNLSLKDQPQGEKRHARPADVVELDEYIESRIEKTLNAVARLRGRKVSVLVKDLFSPFCRVAVVLRRRNGAYEIPITDHLPHSK